MNAALLLMSQAVVGQVYYCPPQPYCPPVVSTPVYEQPLEHIIHATVYQKLYIKGRTDGEVFDVPVVNGIVPRINQKKDRSGRVYRRDFYYEHNDPYKGEKFIAFEVSDNVRKKTQVKERIEPVPEPAYIDPALTVIPQKKKPQAPELQPKVEPEKAPEPQLVEPQLGPSSPSPPSQDNGLFQDVDKDKDLFKDKE